MATDYKIETEKRDEQIKVLQELLRRFENQLSMAMHTVDKYRGELERLRGERPPSSSLSETMMSDWDRRAKENARYFVKTGLLDQTDEEFSRSGLDDFNAVVLPDMPLICRALKPSDMRMLEIGCGIGRMTKWFAKTFGEVYGVDVSPEMVRIGRERLKGMEGVHLLVNNGSDLTLFPDEFFDFCFSYLVFQHFPSKDIVENYLREVYRTLRKNRVFKFQVNGFTGDEYVRTPKDTWLGVSFSKEEISSIASANGFQIVTITGEGSQYMWVTLRK
jgi:SAM-dependent methyltransferase